MVWAEASAPRSEQRAGTGARSRGYVDYERVAGLYRRGRSLPADILGRWAAAVCPYLPAGTSRVIDVGAGTGVFAEAWPRWAAVSVVGVEPAEAMVLAAARADPAVGFVRAVAEALPIQDEHADVVWVSTALHHFADTRPAVGEFARVLRPGGRVLVRTYVPGRTEVTYAEEFPGRSKWVGRFHSEQRLSDLFHEGGFDVVDVTEVLESEEPYSASADWVAMMRSADSMLTALSDDEIAAGLEILRSQPDRVGRLELTLLVFERT